MNDIYLKNVVTLRLDKGKCISCAMCINVCPREVLKLQDDSLEIADLDRCIECGACAMNCPTGALTVNSGVGCASAMINGILKGKEPECGCSKRDKTTTTCC